MNWKEFQGKIAMILLVTLILAVPVPARAEIGDRPKKILFIFSGNFDYPGIALLRKGFSSTFSQHTHLGLPYSQEELQLSAREDETDFRNLAGDLKNKYAQDRPDLVIAGYKQATEFMIRYGDEIFGRIPVVFVGIDVENYETLDFPANFSGIVAALAVQKNIELIRKNHPSVQRIHIIAGASPREQAMMANALEFGKEYAQQVTLSGLEPLPYYHMLAMLNDLTATDTVLYLSMQSDINRRLLDPTLVAQDISKAAKVPVYGIMASYAGSGITGGFLVDHEELGRQAADLSLSILNGAPLPVAPVVAKVVGTYTFDGRELRRWKVNESQLPEHSRIEFAEVSLWETYKWQFISGLGLVSLQALLILGLLANRSKRRKAQKALQVNEERYRMLADNVRDLIWTMDPQGVITYASPYVFFLLGFSPHEVVGRSALDGMSPDSACLFAAKLAEIRDRIATAKPVGSSRLELKQYHRDGRLISLEAHFSVSCDARGKIIGIIGVSRDVTEQKRIFQQLLEEREYRARAEKLASIGMLASGIAHEINQPLNAIKLISSGLVFAYRQGKPRDAADWAANLEEISRQTSRAADIVEHLRALIRRDDRLRIPCSLNLAVERAFDLMRQQFELHRVRFELQMGQNLPAVMGTPTALEEVVLNLLTNALQALDTISERDDKFVRVRTWADQGVFLEVRDNGPGIDPKLAEKIFEPFVSSKASAESLGLGLVILNNIVTLYGGTVRWESEPGAGAGFVVHFPPVLREEEAQAIAYENLAGG